MKVSGLFLTISILAGLSAQLIAAKSEYDSDRPGPVMLLPLKQNTQRAGKAPPPGLGITVVVTVGSHKSMSDFAADTAGQARVLNDLQAAAPGSKVVIFGVEDEDAAVAAHCWVIYPKSDKESTKKLAVLSDTLLTDPHSIFDPVKYKYAHIEHVSFPWITSGLLDGDSPPLPPKSEEAFMFTAVLHDTTPGDFTQAMLQQFRKELRQYYPQITKVDVSLHSDDGDWDGREKQAMNFKIIAPTKVLKEIEYRIAFGNIYPIWAKGKWGKVHIEGGSRIYNVWKSAKDMAPAIPEKKRKAKAVVVSGSVSGKCVALSALKPADCGATASWTVTLSTTSCPPTKTCPKVVKVYTQYDGDLPSESICGLVGGATYNVEYKYQSSSPKCAVPVTFNSKIKIARPSPVPPPQEDPKKAYISTADPEGPTSVELEDACPIIGGPWTSITWTLIPLGWEGSTVVETSPGSPYIISGLVPGKKYKAKCTCKNGKTDEEIVSFNEIEFQLPLKDGNGEPDTPPSPSPKKKGNSNSPNGPKKQDKEEEGANGDPGRPDTPQPPSPKKKGTGRPDTPPPPSPKKKGNSNSPNGPKTQDEEEEEGANGEEPICEEVPEVCCKVDPSICCFEVTESCDPADLRACASKGRRRSLLAAPDKGPKEPEPPSDPSKPPTEPPTEPPSTKPPSTKPPTEPPTEPSTKPPSTKPPSTSTKPPSTKPPSTSTKPPKNSTKPPKNSTKPPKNSTKPPSTKPPSQTTPKLFEELAKTFGKGKTDRCAKTKDSGTCDEKNFGASIQIIVSSDKLNKFAWQDDRTQHYQYTQDLFRFIRNMNIYGADFDNSNTNRAPGFCYKALDYSSGEVVEAGKEAVGIKVHSVDNSDWGAGLHTRIWFKSVQQCVDFIEAFNPCELHTHSSKKSNYRDLKIDGTNPLYGDSDPSVAMKDCAAGECIEPTFSDGSFAGKLASCPRGGSRNEVAGGLDRYLQEVVFQDPLGTKYGRLHHRMNMRNCKRWKIPPTCSTQAPSGSAPIPVSKTVPLYDNGEALEGKHSIQKFKHCKVEPGVPEPVVPAAAPTPIGARRLLGKTDKSKKKKKQKKNDKPNPKKNPLRDNPYFRPEQLTREGEN